MIIWTRKVKAYGEPFGYRLDFAGEDQFPFLMLIREERPWRKRHNETVEWATCLFQLDWLWLANLLSWIRRPRSPIVIKKHFRTSREDRTVNQRYDATCTVTWNVELGPQYRPWFHLYLNEFQMVFTLRLRYRGHTIFEKIQSQDWEPKNRKWMFNHWLFDQLEDRYQDYEHSLPEDPYGSISMYE